MRLCSPLNVLGLVSIAFRIRFLYFSFKHIEVIGKQQRKVPVILSEDMCKALQVLVESRQSCGILPENIFLFPNSALGHLNTKDALNAAKKELGSKLKHPELITSTKMRKYLATVSQVNKWCRAKNVAFFTVVFPSHCSLVLVFSNC